MDDIKKEIDDLTRAKQMRLHPDFEKMIDLGILWWARYHMGLWDRLVVGIRFIFKRDY